MFDSQCLTCNVTMCLTCAFGYLVDIAGTCTICTDYHSMCNSCNSSTCTSCNVGFYVNGISCSPCINFHLQCQ
jgi:hypothetical protein